MNEMKFQRLLSWLALGAFVAVVALMVLIARAVFDLLGRLP